MKLKLLLLLTSISFGVMAEELPLRYHITNVKIFNGWDGELVEGDVIVEGNKIIEVSDEPLASIATANVKLIDGKGCVLSPGFIDCHTHIALVSSFENLENEYDAVYVGAVGAQMAENMLMRGFTSIRDAGGSSIGMMNAVNDGYVIGPRIYSSGAFLTQTSGHLDMHDNTARHRMIGGQPSYAELVGHYITADGEGQVMAAVRENMRKGATQIKIATNGGISSRYAPLDIFGFTQTEIKAIVTAADEFGTYVLSHVYYPDAVKRSLDAGVKSIEHGNMMDEEAMKMLVEKGAFLSIQASASKAQSPAFFTADQRAKHKLARDGFYELIRLAIKYEAKVVFSSDWFGSKDAYELQAQEWIARKDLFNGTEIMRQATGRAGELLALSGERNPFKEGKLGVIEKGAYADLVLIQGNPLKDISILAKPTENLKLIMKDGTVHKNTL